jgi:hypothetical protein
MRRIRRIGRQIGDISDDLNAGCRQRRSGPFTLVDLMLRVHQTWPPAKLRLT